MSVSAAIHDLQALSLPPPAHSLGGKQYNMSAVVQRAVLAFERGAHAACIKYCDRALDVQPDLLEALLLRADARVELQVFDEAIEDYDRALKCDPDNTRALFGKDEAQYWLDCAHDKQDSV